MSGRPAPYRETGEGDMRRSLEIGVVTTILVLGIGGCTASGVRGGLAAGPVSPSLVLPTAYGQTGFSRAGRGGYVGWEQSRNDDSLGVGRSSGLVQWQAIVVRDTDRRWTQNGRIRESSRRLVRTIRRGVIRTE